MNNEFESFYPPKPLLEKEAPRPGHFAVTVFSMVLFVMAFLFFFDRYLVLLLQLLGVIIVHELGHFLMMKRFGYHNVRMLFIPLLGAFVHGNKDEYQQKQSIWVILAGPLPGIILGSVLGAIGVTYGITWMVQVAFLSFILNVANLFPLLPLDGGRLLNILFFERMEMFQLVFAFISSLVVIVTGFLTGTYVLMIFGFLMGFQVRGMQRKYLVHKSLRDSNVEYRTSYEKLTNRAYHFIRKEVLENTPGLRRFIEESEENQDELTSIVAGEVSNMLIPPQHADAGLFYRILIILLWIAAIAGPVYQVTHQNFLHYV